jgi:small subunit ribosomal protein S4
MGRYTGPQCRLCRGSGVKLFLKGERCHSDHCAVSKKRPAPGKGPRVRPRKLTDYGIQLREKQKMKRLYGLVEKQFVITFHRALKMTGKTGDNLVALLERRLDNIVYRLRFASSRKQARQLVLHGHVHVNGRRVDVASYLVKENDKVAIKEKSQKLVAIKESLKEYSKAGVVPWLEVNPDSMVGMLKIIPKRNDVTDLGDIREQLVVELYSK